MFFNYTFVIVLLGVIFLSIISSIIGTFTVLKNESLLSDGISHAALSGICLSYIFFRVKNIYILLLGALIIGLICIYIIHLIQVNSKIEFDSAISLILSTFFGLGLVLLTYIKKIPGNKAGLKNYIFGQASTLSIKDVYILIIISIILILIICLFWKEFKISIFDKEFSLTLGINSKFYSNLLSFILVIVVIVGIQIAGVILISAMIITPSVIARFWTYKLNNIVVLSVLFSIISSILGVYISNMKPNIPTGPIIILTMSIFFLISLFISPKGLFIYFFKKYKLKGSLK